jgi:hypothetical protein
VIRFLAGFGLLLAGAAPAFGQLPLLEAETFFELKVRPVFSTTCGKCHGGKKVKGGLRLDSREVLIKGGDSGPAVVPGDPDKSLLLQALRQKHATLKMPPDKKLPDEQIADIATWIKQGAAWPASSVNAIAAGKSMAGEEHWAFRQVKPVIPPPDPAHWSENPIDLFIMANLRAEGLKPVGVADKRTMIRRATFDLVGLPPTPAEIDAFLADESSEAYAKLVDRLLASPLYGERWGRHWMDVAHYADTAGDNADYPIPEIALYRDYIIDSFNADKPFDQFVREQIAGDILAKQGPKQKYAEQVIATGFLALSRRYATAPYELWHLSLEDTIETTGAAFLGLNLRCARCHDHKFDPVTMEDYYGLYAIFASTTFPYCGSEELHSKNLNREHFVPLVPPDEAAPKLKAHQAKIEQVQAELSWQEKEDPLAKQVADLNQRLEGLKKQAPSKGIEKPSNPDFMKQVNELTHERDRLNKQLQEKLRSLKTQFRNLQEPGLPLDLPGAYAVSDSKPVEVRIQLKGDPDNPGPAARRSVLRFLAGDKKVDFPADGSGRLQLAQWITRHDNPLTARVIVNRIWQHHFGSGIVGTPSNFGTRGDLPTHPELLDWLTGQFIKDGWSIKALHRKIMLSKTYQLASSSDPVAASKDPGNRWHWRFDRRRLEAEALRDAMLMVGGNLELKRPGPHPFPPISQWTWTQHQPFKAVYPSNCRSVYLMTQRLQRHPYLALFDGPDTNHSTEKRSTSTVPLQALYLMNNDFVKTQAEGLARRLIAHTAEERSRLEQAFILAWVRPAQNAEVVKGLDYLRRYKEELIKGGAPQDKVELEAWTSYARVILTANEFLYVD